jgi:hydrogenase maturation protease
MGERIGTLVLGIGNILWADEGFGVRAVEALHRQYRFPDSVVLVDGGTQGLYLLPYVQAARRMLVFDAIDYGLAPGTLKVIRDGEIPAYLGIYKMSLHQSSFQEVLSLATLSGARPETALLIGVQPEDLTDFGGSLRDSVKARLPEALQIALSVLDEWGVAGVPRNGSAADTLSAPKLAIDGYEEGRPVESEACRVGDSRFLRLRAGRTG